jgi:flagellar assembly factor FliW
MPLAYTQRFGALEYDQASVLSFPCGLPGFERETRFVVVEQTEFAPIVFLQSLDGAELCFFAAPVGAVDAGYAMGVTVEDLERLGLDPTRQPIPGEEVLCLALLCAPEGGPMTANLLAPVVVNPRTRVAVQAVRADARYSHQHLLQSGAVPGNRWSSGRTSRSRSSTRALLK